MAKTGETAKTAKTAKTEIKVVGESGQISLGKRYAGKTFTLERLEDGSILLRPVALVPESRLWPAEEPRRSEIAEGGTRSRTDRVGSGARAVSAAEHSDAATPDWVADWLRHRIPAKPGLTAREILERGRGRSVLRGAEAQETKPRARQAGSVEKTGKRGSRRAPTGAGKGRRAHR